MKTNARNFFLIYKELEKYNKNDFSLDLIIKATNDLIKYSKNDYINKSEIKIASNDNRKPVDLILKNKNFETYNSYYDDIEIRDIEENKSYQKFKQINNLY